MEESGPPSVSLESRAQGLRKSPFPNQHRDDDDVSLTSSVESEQQEEYEVEGIYHQLTFPDGIKYLVKWKGYPDVRCTWEPAEAFSNPQTLQDWKKARRQILRGQRPAFDYESWNKETQAWWGAKKARKRRRREKRILLGIPVAPESSDHEEEEEGFEELYDESDHRDSESGPDESVHAELDSLFDEAKSSSDEAPLIDAIPNRPKRPLESSPSSAEISHRAGSSSTGPIDSPRSVNTPSKLQHQPRKRPRLGDQLAASAVTGGLTENIPPPNNTVGTRVLHGRRLSLPNATNLPRLGVATTSQNPATGTPVHPIFKRPPQPAVSFASSSGPARKPRMVRRLAQARTDRVHGNTAAFSSFKKLSTKHKHIKASRYEPPPDIRQLDLRRPSDWDSLPGPSRPPFTQVRRASSDQLFVDQMDEPQSPTPVDISSTKEPDAGGSPASAKAGFNDLLGTYPSFAFANPTASNALGSSRVLGSGKASAELDPDEPNATSLSTSSLNMGMRIKGLSLAETRKPADKIERHVSDEVSRYTSAKPTGPPTMFRIKGRELEKGDILCCMYFGETGSKIGDIRLCGIPPFFQDQLLRFTRRHKEIELSFKHTCTTADLYNLRDKGKASLPGMHHGWIVGFDDTDPLINGMAQNLSDHDEIALSNVAGEYTMICYPRDLTGSYLFDRKWRFPSETKLRVAIVRETYNLGNLRARNEKPSFPPRCQDSSTTLHEIQEGGVQHPKTINNDNNTLKGPPTTFKEPLSPMKEKQSSASTGANVPSSEKNYSTVAVPSTFNPLDSITSPITINDTSPATPAPPTQQENFLVASYFNSSSPTTDKINSAKNASRSPEVRRKSITEDLEMAGAGDPNEINLDKLFLESYHITFRELCTIKERDQHARNFYLWFPPDEPAQAQLQLLTALLLKHRCGVFSNTTTTDWERFRQVLQNVKCGAMVFHETFTAFEDLPGFSSVVRSAVNLWCASLTTPLRGPAEKTYFQRIFPRGMMLLITEDFMVREKKATVSLLSWYKEKLEGNRARLLVLRPNVISWLVQKVEEPNGDTNTELYMVMLSLILSTASDGHVYKLPVKKTDLDPTFDYMEQYSVVSFADLPKYGSRTVEDNPTLPRGLSGEENKADHLIEFFAGWSLLNREKYRRFPVVTSMQPLQRWLNWQHLHIHHNAQSIFATLGISNPDKYFDLATKGQNTTTTSLNPKPAIPQSSPHAAPNTPKLNINFVNPNPTQQLLLQPPNLQQNPPKTLTTTTPEVAEPSTAVTVENNPVRDPRLRHPLYGNTPAAGRSQKRVENRKALKYPEPYV